MLLPRREFVELAERITADCNSIRHSIKVIYVELAVFVLAVTLGLGIQIGKALCN